MPIARPSARFVARPAGVCAAWRPTHESHLHHSRGAGFPGVKRASARRIDAISSLVDVSSTMQDINARIAARVRRVARGLGAEPRSARQPLLRQPLDVLARRAWRDQPHGRGARKDRHGPRLHPRLAVRRRRRAGRIPCRAPPIAASWKDPQSGYVRRNISPPNFPSPIRIVEVAFPAGAQGVV